MQLFIHDPSNNMIELQSLPRACNQTSMDSDNSAVSVSLQ